MMLLSYLVAPSLLQEVMPNCRRWRRLVKYLEQQPRLAARVEVALKAVAILRARLIPASIERSCSRDLVE